MNAMYWCHVIAAVLALFGFYTIWVRVTARRAIRLSDSGKRVLYGDAYMIACEDAHEASTGVILAAFFLAAVAWRIVPPLFH